MTADDRIDDLEYRLEQYHEWLVDSIAQRDRLAIDAAWGVHFALYSTLAYLALIAVIYRYLPNPGWLVGVGLGFAFLAIHFIVHAWSNGARMKEVDRFAKLPDWQIKVG